MKKIIKYLPHIILIALILWVFKSWFSTSLITAGDFWPYSKAIYSSRSIFLYAWDLNTGNGLGSFVSPLLWIYLNFGTPITILGSWLGFSWSVIEKIWYLYPFLILSLVSSYSLFSRLFSGNKFSLLSAGIFTMNSYILMVAGGGQISGIGMAYSLIPLILYFFITAIESFGNNKITFKKSLLASTIFSIQFIFDIRIAYITLAIFFLLFVFEFLKDRKQFRKLSIYLILIPAVVVFLLNAFWIIPTAVNRKNPVQELGTAYSSTSAVNFFSFAKFEDSLSLLHPNWPENVFGKVGFLKPEFLLLPILAFSSLFFLKKEEKRKRKFVIFFVSLGLVGAFLAKGTNEPFGQIYLFLFTHFPGFIMFRDPTKWYILTALSYSMLIPYCVEKIYELLKSKLS